MNVFISIFGEGKDLSLFQMSARAIVIYFVAMILIRVSGRRTFGKKSSFDITISIILGAVLSRAIVGASPFISTVIASFALVLLHRLIAMAIWHSKIMGQLVKGEGRMLYENGKFNENNLRKCLLTRDDIMTDLRIKTNSKSLDDVKTIYMENTGELSFVTK
ncbi:DUF421 domain-containing protein [Mucilaginibacter terrenus]|uniref:DUF421 domain-containing protein n=1 Tax=Mucilaginibacter terrenus TaxID=2482727 RepID=A0A3E2NU53_9SPHI|nr:YetF domain-containing protein [Mucilaginibacter terrenus]RFZ84451.1 DUF421 domain-containing protein [Mucilaginibacter terrenus]